MFFKHRLKSSGPWLGAQWTIPVPCSKSTKFASSLGLKVNAGHGLNYDNVRKIAAIAEIKELNIGHSIISHAVVAGLSSAVSEMKQLVDNQRN